MSPPPHKLIYKSKNPFSNRAHIGKWVCCRVISIPAGALTWFSITHREERLANSLLSKSLHRGRADGENFKGTLGSSLASVSASEQQRGAWVSLITGGQGVIWAGISQNLLSGRFTLGVPVASLVCLPCLFPLLTESHWWQKHGLFLDKSSVSGLLSSYYAPALIPLLRLVPMMDLFLFPSWEEERWPS